MVTRNKKENNRGRKVSYFLLISFYVIANKGNSVIFGIGLLP